MTLTTLQQFTADFAGDANQSRYAGKYLGVINQAQQQFAADSNALFKDNSFSSVANTATVDLPTDFMWEESVNYDGLPLKPASRLTLALLYPGTDWTLLTGTPKYYMVDPEEATKVLRFIPIPTEADSGVMRYYPLPTSVASDSDVILNSSTLLTRFHLGVAAFAAVLLLMSETQTPDMVTKRRELMELYQDAVSKAIEKFGNTVSEPMRIRPK